MVIWIDNEDGTRGGSIYLRRLHSYMLEAGMRSRYMSARRLRQRVRLILMSWMSQCEVRATVPREIPTMIFCKKKRGYIQSPIEEWSWLSRIGLWVLMRVSGRSCEFVCVSRTTQRSAEGFGCSVLNVEYAKLDSLRKVSVAEKRVTERKELVLIVMDNELVDKGYLRHLSITDAVATDNRVIVEVYGRESGGCYTNKGETVFMGFKENPFEEAKANNIGKKIVYLGCSRFEGLHMAVAEAAIAGIPSILSDIPAHRELEEIAGRPLVIGGDVNENIMMLKRIIQEEEYNNEVAKCVDLAEGFSRLGMPGVGV